MEFGKISSQPPVPSSQIPTAEAQASNSSDAANRTGVTPSGQDSLPQKPTESQRQLRRGEGHFQEQVTRAEIEGRLERKTGPAGLSKELTESEEATVDGFRQYFLENTEVGTLTADREGRINHAYVPGHGTGRGSNSGVTIGIGVEVRHQNRQALADALNANAQLRAYLMSVPSSTGLEAEQWVDQHPIPTPLTPEQVSTTYSFGAQRYSEMARNRLTGSSSAHPAVRANEGVRLTPEEYASLDPRVKELLTDIAFNSAAMAHGRQNSIAEALQSGLDLQNVNQATRAYEQFRHLRIFVENLSENAQGAGGRMKRLGWIDARMQELLPQVDSQYLNQINN